MGDLEARREARRRRILENSESRLQKIINNDGATRESKPEGPNREVPTHNVPISNNVTTSKIDYNQQTNPDTDHANADLSQRKRVSFNLNKAGIGQVGSDVRTIYQNPISEESDSVSELEFLNLDEQKSSLRDWIIIILAVVVRYLFLLSEQYSLFGHEDFLVKHHINKIFVPFFFFEMTEYTLFRPTLPQSGLLNMLFMLNLRLPPEHLNKIIAITRISLRIVQDIMIYFFTFLSFDQIILFLTQE